MNKAVFLDRDGIINVDKSYLYKIEEFEFCEGIIEVLKYLENLGYLLIVVTNQSGIGRGYYTQDDFNLLTSWMLDKLKEDGIEIQKVFYCPHVPDENCKCRKPKPFMIDSAIEEFNIEPLESWMVGDKRSDIQTAINANVPNTIFVNNSTCSDAKYSIKSILDIMSIIKN